MNYVLDSGAAFKWEVPEIGTDRAILLRDEYRQAIHQLLAPDIFAIEVAGALAKAERQLRIPRADGWNAWLAIMTDAPILVPTLPLLPRAYEIASRYKVAVYDSLYVALAEREGCECVTADDRLVRSLQPVMPFVIALSSLP